LTKLFGYQQSRCQYGIRGWNHFAFMQSVFIFVELFSFMLEPTQSCTGNGVSFYMFSALEVARLAQNYWHSCK